MLGYGEKKLRPYDIRRCAAPGRDRLARPAVITAAAGLIIGVLDITGLSFALTRSWCRSAPVICWLLLAVAAMVSIILGMGMPTVGVYVLLAALVAPAMVKIGLTPMAAHMFVCISA